MTTPHWIIIIAALLVATRVTRIITADRVFAPVRDWVIRKYGMAHSLTYWVHCPWCVGAWVALVAALVVGFLAPAWPVSLWWVVPGLWAGYAWACGLTERLVDEGA